MPAKKKVRYNKPFLNLLAGIKWENPEKTPKELCQMAAELWRNMSFDEQKPFYQLALQVRRYLPLEKFRVRREIKLECWHRIQREQQNARGI